MVKNNLQVQSSLVKVPPPPKPPGAITTYADAPRARFGFGVASQSSGRIYKISFDDAPGALYWRCSCAGCCTHGQCKHLTAAGLQGRKYGKQIAFAKKYGFLK